MRKVLLSIVYYLAIIPLILVIHAWSPTSLAGPGLDLVVYFCSLIISVTFMATSLSKLKPANRLSYMYCLIHIVGTGLVVLFLYHEWTTPR